jgi:hypothetical protein
MVVILSAAKNLFKLHFQEMLGSLPLAVTRPAFRSKSSLRCGLLLQSGLATTV